MSFILVLDQGTTSSRALLLDEQGQICRLAQQEFTQFFPRPGWVEHDPEEIWSSQLTCARQVINEQGCSPADIAAIGITNQRETTVVWDRANGKPVCPAIVWQDRRTADICDKLREEGHAELIRSKTGLVPDAYFSATKLKWILEKIESRDNLAFGTIDSWLIWKLTAGQAHVTDASNASRTMLFNIHDQDWDAELLDLFAINPDLLPDVLDSSTQFGLTDPSLLGAAIPITGVAGDQQAALFGQMCHEPGMVKDTYGTGCFIMMNTGPEPVLSTNNLLTTVAWRLGGQTTYALEGSVFIAGAVVQWLRDGLQIIQDSSEVEALAASAEDHGGVYFVPAFTGLGAPHWDPHARGSLFGLTRGSDRGHIARAALESIAFQSADVLEAMRADAGLDIMEMRVDGGASANNLLMQFQADLLRARVQRPGSLESTAMGVGFLAGLGAGIWPDLESLHSLREQDHEFRPEMPETRVRERMAEWHRALDRTRGWEKA